MLQRPLSAASAGAAGILLLLALLAPAAARGGSAPPPTPTATPPPAAALRALNPALDFPASAAVERGRDLTWTVTLAGAQDRLRCDGREYGPGVVWLDQAGRPITGLTSRAYYWARSKAFAPLAWLWLLVISFAESSFFPIPPDVLLIPLAIFRPWELALLFAALCTLASTLGGLFGYVIGRYGGRPLLQRLFSAEKIRAVERYYQKYDVWAVAAGGFTPLPYKLFTISAGVFRLDVPRFILASALSRGARFFLFAGLCAAFGRQIEPFIENYLGWITIIFFVGLAGGFWAFKVLARRSARAPAPEKDLTTKAPRHQEESPESGVRSPERSRLQTPDSGLHVANSPWVPLCPGGESAPSPLALCVVVPAYREERNIAAVVQGVRAGGWPLLVVDDGSPDRTAEAAAAAGARVIRHEVNRGKGAALATGAAAAFAEGAAAVLFLDGDGQHDPAEIPAFLAAAATGADVVLGTRMGDLETMPLVRRWANRLSSWLLSTLAGTRLTDTQSGYRLVRRAAWEAASPTSGGFNFESEFLVRAAWRGYRIREVPIRTIYHAGAVSKFRPVRDTLRFFGLVARLARV